MSLSDQDVDAAIENAGTKLSALCSDVERRLRGSIRECQQAEWDLRRATADACRMPRWRWAFLAIDAVVVVVLLTAMLGGAS